MKILLYNVLFMSGERWNLCNKHTHTDTDTSVCRSDESNYCLIHQPQTFVV